MAVVIAKLLNCVAAFAILTIYGMVLTYIAQIKSELVELMNENICLFDKMHEGVAIVTESDQSLQFLNKPAVDLLLQKPERGILDVTGKLSTTSMIELQETHFRKPIFHPLQIGVESVQNLDQYQSDAFSYNSHGQKELLSLARIIENELKDDPNNIHNFGGQQEQVNEESKSSKFYAVLKKVN